MSQLFQYIGSWNLFQEVFKKNCIFFSTILTFKFVGGEMSAGKSGYRAGEHAFARIAAQRYIRAQKTRSKCRRRFTALHHHTRTPRLRFPTHNSKFRQEGKKTELYRLIRELCSVLLFENRFISCFKNENRINSRL